MSIEDLSALRDKLIMMDALSQEEKTHLYGMLQEQIIEIWSRS